MQYDAPLTADIEGIAGPVSHWVHTSTSPAEIARDAAEAVRQAGFSRVATLMLPADVSWGDNPNGAEPADRTRDAAARARQPYRSGGGQADLRQKMHGDDRRTRDRPAEQGLLLSRIGKACGARVSTEVFPTRQARGAGTAVLERLPYLAELAIDHIKELDHLILIGAACAGVLFRLSECAQPDRTAAVRGVPAGPSP